MRKEQHGGFDKTLQVPLTLSNPGTTDIVFRITGMFTCNNCGSAPTAAGPDIYSGITGDGFSRTPGPRRGEPRQLHHEGQRVHMRGWDHGWLGPRPGRHGQRDVLDCRPCPRGSSNFRRPSTGGSLRDGLHHPQLEHSQDGQRDRARKLRRGNQYYAVAPTARQGVRLARGRRQPFTRREPFEPARAPKEQRCDAPCWPCSRSASPQAGCRPWGRGLPRRATALRLTTHPYRRRTD